MMQEIDTFNRWAVGIQANGIGILNPPRGLMTPKEALVLAAWLVTLADPSGEDFTKILEQVQST